MRIEAYTQVQQLYQSQKVSRTQKTQNTAHTDRLQISSQGKDFQTAKAAVPVRRARYCSWHLTTRPVSMWWTLTCNAARTCASGGDRKSVV